jgi:hypothetical protein
MATLFVVVTVACIFGLVLAFFLWTERDTRTLTHFLVSGCVFAVANQVGNGGWPMFAVVLIIAGVGYAALVTVRPAP